MQTALRQHEWVKHVITPVEVLPGLESEPVVMVDPDRQQAAEENAAYGCLKCSEPLHTAFGTECKGDE